jgi:predicted TIM-barrel fold metal-dependent hydrolase
VLIHGGAPSHEAAAYLAGNKSHVWVDLSAMPFLYAPSEMARAIRMYLLFAPTRTLFGTDPMAALMIPVGPETAHLMLCKVLRRALYLALAGLVDDGVFGETQAIEVGRGGLRENARRLYGWV